MAQQIQNTAEQEAVDMGNDEIDSLIEGLILEKQTGGYFEKALHHMGNKVQCDSHLFFRGYLDIPRASRALSCTGAKSPTNSIHRQINDFKLTLAIADVSDNIHQLTVSRSDRCNEK